MEEDRYTRITLRIPKDLQTKLARAAFATSKSQNAEIIARLQASFQAEPFEIPAFLQRAPAGATVTQDGAVVLHLTLTPGMTVEKVLELLEAAQMALPAGTRLVIGPG